MAMQGTRGSFAGSKNSFRSGTNDKPAAASWVKQQRNTAGLFDPKALSGKLSADVLLEDSRRTVRLCHTQIQDDLDLLHEQVHAEIHSAVSQELQGVAHSIARVRREAMEELQHALVNDLGPLTEELRRVLAEDIGPLRQKVDEMYATHGIATPRGDSKQSQPEQAADYGIATPRGDSKQSQPSQPADGNNPVLSEGPSKALHEALHEDMSSLRSQVEDLCRDTKALQEQGPKAAQEIAQVLGAVEKSAREAALQVAQAEVQGAMSSAREAATEALKEASKETKAFVEQEVGRVEGRVEGSANAIKGEMVALAERMGDELVKLQSRIDASDTQHEETTGEIQVECAERVRLSNAVDGLTDAVDGLKEGMEQSALQHVEAQGRSQSALQHVEQLAKLGEARFRDAQETVADLEQRLNQRHGSALQTTSESLAGRVDVLASEVALRFTHIADEQRQSGLQDMGQRFLQLSRRCRDEFRVARASWARVVDWLADVDIEKIREDGRASIASPTFSAACLDGLQIRLRLVESSKGWAYGVFLCAPMGKISFRLHVAGKSQTFEGVSFGRGEGKDAASNAPEWGSPRIAVLSGVPEAKVPIKLEIIDVVVPVMAAPQDSGEATNRPTNEEGEDSVDAPDPLANDEVRAPWPVGLSGYARICDEAVVASKEAAAIRAGLVRRVEWRVTRVSERLEAARRAFSGSSQDDEALEPLVSPPFSAAGLDGLQMSLYPLGYRPKGDEMCGFFLACPRGVFVKCRAFVGDAFRTFEHEYEKREPFGRGGVCRLGEKAGSDDSVLCGIEFLEVRQESHSQVKGGPFGLVMDQVKVVLSPGGGGMDAVRELSELKPSGGEPAGGKERRPNRAAQGTSPTAADKKRLGGGASKSLPILKSGAVASVVAPGNPGAAPRVMEMLRGRRQMDM